MNPTKKSTATGAFATGAVAFAAVSLVYLWPNLDDPVATVTTSGNNAERIALESTPAPNTVDSKDQSIITESINKTEPITNIKPQP